MITPQSARWQYKGLHLLKENMSEVYESEVCNTPPTNSASSHLDFQLWDVVGSCGPNGTLREWLSIHKASGKWPYPSQVLSCLPCSLNLATSSFPASTSIIAAMYKYLRSQSSVHSVQGFAERNTMVLNGFEVSFAKPVLKFCECRACAWEYRYPNRCDSSLHSPLDGWIPNTPNLHPYIVYIYNIIYICNMHTAYISQHIRVCIVKTGGHIQVLK